MSWGRNCLAAVSTAAISALAFPAAALAGIVVASSGPSAANYPAGRKLPDDAKITLKAADSVTILDAKGTRTLHGAGTFTVGAPGSTSRASAFAMLTQQRGASRVRTGAIRASGGEPVRPNLWYVDVAKQGTMCVLDPASVRVWRPVKDGSASYTVTGMDHAATLDFADKTTVAPWDSAMSPVTQGASYTIAPAAGGAPVNVTFAILPDQQYSPEDLAMVLMSKGCSAQVDLLATTLALPTDGDGSGAMSM